MEKITIYKNKGETFKCQLQIDGAEIKDTVIRLCLEFQTHPNYFFYGDLKENGECEIEIPRLKNLDENTGQLTVEAIADSVYFKVYEAQVEFRNSVEVSMRTPTVKKTTHASIRLEEFELASDTKTVETSIDAQGLKDEQITPRIHKTNPYLCRKLDQEGVVANENDNNSSSENNNFRSFNDYRRSKQNGSNVELP